MKKQTISMIKQRFKENIIDQNFIDELRKDERKGVQQLVASYDKRIQEEEKLEKQFNEMCRYERAQYENGNNFIAGVDEAGRGPLAGPVVAAAVILPLEFKLLGLNDSKQLNEERRNVFFDYIKEHALSYGVSIVSNQEIDEKNIFESTKIAMHRAIDQLSPSPNHILIDAVPLDGLACTSESIIKGDSKSVSIAAASILAKVTRDRIMNKIHEEYPVYDFQSNMGYGTKDHLERLMEYGPSPYHRKTFAPIKKSIQS